jgi:hypothetical protein
MKKDLFVITGLSCFASTKADALKLTPEMRVKYSGRNCKMVFKRVVDLKTNKIEEDSAFMHCGNTNYDGAIAFDSYIKGIQQGGIGPKGNPIFFLESEQIIKGVIIEMEYNTKKVIGKKVETHLVPIKPVKIIGYMNVEKAQKTKDKVTALF